MKYWKIQILTIEQLLAGAKVDRPPTAMTFKQAAKVVAAKEENLAFDLEAERVSE